eukprot:5199406-Amphidinium_carterae.1
MVCVNGNLHLRSPSASRVWVGWVISLWYRHAKLSLSCSCWEGHTVYGFLRIDLLHDASCARMQWEGKLLLYDAFDALHYEMTHAWRPLCGPSGQRVTQLTSLNASMLLRTRAL